MDSWSETKSLIVLMAVIAVFYILGRWLADDLRVSRRELACLDVSEAPESARHRRPESVTAYETARLGACHRRPTLA